MKQYITENVWVWAGTALVLCTLSGATFRTAMFITAVTVLIHGVGTFLKRGD